MSEQQCWHRDPSACKCKEVYLKSQLAAANEAKEKAERGLQEAVKFLEQGRDLVIRYEAIHEAAEQKTAELAAIVEASDKLASWAMCAREDRRVNSDSEPMVAQTLMWTTELLRLAQVQRDLSASSPAAQVLAERDKRVTIEAGIKELGAIEKICHEFEGQAKKCCSSAFRTIELEAARRAAALSSKSAIGPEEGGEGK